MESHASECFNQTVVTGFRHEHGWCRIAVLCLTLLVTAIDATVIENQNRYRKLVAADGFDFHPTESESAVAFNGQNLLATRNGSTDAVTHTDTHHAPGTCIETQARMIHVDDVTGIVQCIGTFVHDVDVLIRFQHIAHHLQGVEIVHRLGRSIEFLAHFLRIGLFHGIDAVHPSFPAMDIERLHLGKNRIQ